MDADRAQHVVSCWDVHVPVRQVGDDVLGSFRAERLGDLPRDVHEELLQHLNAQAAVPRFPELLDQRPRT
jgi:hypothetical protein